MREFTEADGKWLSMVRSLFGGRVTTALTGAAPIAPEILEFFHACGVPIYEGYGLTESSGVISLNSAGASRAGTVGRPIDGIAVRIAEDGEIMAAGNMFAGYHANDAATGEALVDGWLHTGDLGEFDADGFLRVTGRKKELIIPASGKNISPNNIENDLRRSPWIAHAVLHGDRRPHLVALITVDAEEITPWAQARGLPTKVTDLVGTPELTDLIQGVVDEVNATYSRPEQIRRFALLDTDFSQEGGELTPTMKLRRAAINEKYQGILDGMYHHADL
jgi:long-chain acyl-CoA synthetase